MLKQGVPQGSILGPFLFLAYINDIVSIPHSPQLIMYADDTNIFFTSNNLASLESSVNDYMRRLSNWLKNNRLQLNAKKTTYIIFRPINKPLCTTFKVMFNNQLLERVREQKFLGVWFQEELSWKAHVEHLWIELARTVGTLYKLTTLIPL